MPLAVYKSSAGSGKTFTLVKDYLSICMRNPHDFRRILAITFTNKAAAEMKERIVGTLKAICEGKENDLSIEILQESGLSNEIFLDRAAKVLQLVIHNYEDFSVSTIDSFIHRISRTFSNELKLPAGFELIIDKDEIVPEIVDELFNKLGYDKLLTELILDYVFNQLDNDKNYRVRSQLSSFVEYTLGEEIFNRSDYLEELNKADFRKIIQNVKNTKAKTSKIIENKATEILKLFADNGLEIDDFAGKKTGIYSYFYKNTDVKKINGAYTVTPLKNPVKAYETGDWINKSARADKHNTFESIRSICEDAYEQIYNKGKKYILLDFIESKIYSLGLIGEINKVFDNFSRFTSKVHISEFNKRINQIISHEATPFIYEKLGVQFKYFLIDEFQDTSVLQLENLLPLIEESLANNNFSMLVGDEKQSIYRFRKGEVALFANLPALYNNDGSNLAKSREFLLRQHYQEHQLDVNYRSGKTIVEFNNEFFSSLINNEADYLKKHYKHLEQKAKHNFNSYVSLQTVTATDVAEFNEQKHKFILEYIDESVNAGFNYNDICILCSNKKYIKEIAAFLLENNLEVESSESLLVNSSPKIKLIIAWLSLLLKPDEKIYIFDFVINYYKIKQIKNPEVVLSQLVENKINGLEFISRLSGWKDDLTKVMELSVYEIVEYVVRKMEFDKTSDAFLSFFLDFVYSSQQKSNFSIADFLIHWHERKKNIFIETPNNENAVKIMTAHKSKGLAFDVVIADLRVSKNRSGKTVWTGVEEAGIENLPISLIPLNKSLEAIDKGNLYDEEELKSRLDFINLIYVCFTRAKKSLYAIGMDKQTKSGKGEEFGDLLKTFIANNSAEDGRYVKGEIFNTEVKSDTEKDDENNIKLYSSDFYDVIKIANSRDIKIDPDKNPREYGLLIHELLSEVYSVDDIDFVVNKLSNDHSLTNELKTRVKQSLYKVVNHEELKSFYQKDKIIKNEFGFTDINSGVHRPDRLVFESDRVVVIDYKTGARESKHDKQLLRYADGLSKMGYNNIESLLVYLNEDGLDIVSVR